VICDYSTNTGNLILKKKKEKKKVGQSCVLYILELKMWCRKLHNNSCLFIKKMHKVQLPKHCYHLKQGGIYIFSTAVAQKFIKFCVIPANPMHMSLMT